jgi:hypothetical protein
MDGCAAPAREGQDDNGRGQDGAHERCAERSRACERAGNHPPWGAQGKLCIIISAFGAHRSADRIRQESALADTVRRLGELEDVPLGDVYDLRKRAWTLGEQWRESFGDEVVDLQRGVFLHAS